MAKYILISILACTLILTGCFNKPEKTQTTKNSDTISETEVVEVTETAQAKTTPTKATTKATDLPVRGLYTDTSKRSIELDQILSGGPGKDGIPAIDNPTFKAIGEEAIDDEILGIFVEFDGVQRFYPYTVLVWHEIVNDSINDHHFAVTFCPLCGSAIVFDRNLDGNLTTFGVSGMLYESNLLMYDRLTESLWSQVAGKAVVGEFTETELTWLPMQLLTFGELKEKFPNTQVLSNDTGYSRNYGFYPYGDYDTNDDLYFPVTVQNKRFHEKEMMYVVNANGYSIAMKLSDLTDGEHSVNIEGKLALDVAKDGGEITVLHNGTPLPGYYEMWFSWATHHEEDGLVWEK